EFVRRLFPGEVISEFAQKRAQNAQRGFHGTEQFSVGDMHLRAAAGFSAELVESRIEIKRTEANAGESERLHRGAEPVRIEPGCAENLKRTRGAAALRNIRSFQQALARIHNRRIDGRHIRRWKNPGQS